MSTPERQTSFSDLPAMYTTADGRIVTRVDEPVVEERRSMLGRAIAGIRSEQSEEAAEITSLPEKVTLKSAIKWTAGVAIKKVIVPSVVLAGALPIAANTGLEQIHINASKFPTYDMEAGSLVPDLFHDGKVTLEQTIDSYDTIGNAVIHIKNLVS
jgi:hypothetical protein